MFRKIFRHSELEHFCLKVNFFFKYYLYCFWYLLLFMYIYYSLLMNQVLLLNRVNLYGVTFTKKWRHYPSWRPKSWSFIKCEMIPKRNDRKNVSYVKVTEDFISSFQHDRDYVHYYLFTTKFYFPIKTTRSQVNIF